MREGRKPPYSEVIVYSTVPDNPHLMGDEGHIWNRTIALSVYTVNEYDYDRNAKMFETIETDSIAFAKGENP